MGVMGFGYRLYPSYGLSSTMIFGKIFISRMSGKINEVQQTRAFWNG